MDRTASIALLFWALFLGAVFLLVDPAQSVAPGAAERAGLGLTVALAWAIAAVGAGGAVLVRAAPDLLDDERGLLHAGIAGGVLWSMGALALAAVDALQPVPLGALGVALAAGWLLRPPIRLSCPSPVLGLALLLVFIPGLVETLAPPTDTDELYYHLGLPRKMLDVGGLVGGVLDPSGNRPLLIHLPMAAVLATGGETAPRLLHLIVSLGVVAATASLGRRHLGEGAGAAAALLLAGSWSFVRGGGILGTDMPAALAVLAALDAGLRGRAVGLAIAGGAALGAKYTAGGAVAGVFLVARLPVRARFLAGAAAVAALAPWWVRNALEGLHPLFPFAGWPDLLPFQYLEKYGAGREPLDMILLPWNAVMSAEITSFRFLGRVTPALLALLPAACWAAWRSETARRLLIAAAAIIAFWATGPHLLRFLLPGLPLLALCAGAGAARLIAAGVPGRAALCAMAMAGVAGVPANLGPVVGHTGDRINAALGGESRDAFYSRTLPPWPAVRWANRHLPDDAEVAVLFTWHGYLLERRTRLGSVEDHVPVRHWLLQHGAASVSALRAEGISHVLVGRQRFIRKAYPFVSSEELEALFHAPTRSLEDQLLMEATLLYEEAGTRVFELEPVGSTP